MEFGLDRFELAQRHALQGQPGMQLGQSGEVGHGVEAQLVTLVTLVGYDVAMWQSP